RFGAPEAVVVLRAVDADEVELEERRLLLRDQVHGDVAERVVFDVRRGVARPEVGVFFGDALEEAGGGEGAKEFPVVVVLGAPVFGDTPGDARAGRDGPVDERRLVDGALDYPPDRIDLDVFRVPAPPAHVFFDGIEREVRDDAVRSRVHARRHARVGRV